MLQAHCTLTLLPQVVVAKQVSHEQHEEIGAVVVSLLHTNSSKKEKDDDEVVLVIAPTTASVPTSTQGHHHHHHQETNDLLRFHVSNIVKIEPELLGFGGLRAQVRIEHFLDAEIVTVSLKAKTAVDALVLQQMLKKLRGNYHAGGEGEEGGGGRNRERRGQGDDGGKERDSHLEDDCQQAEVVQEEDKEVGEVAVLQEEEKKQQKKKRRQSRGLPQPRQDDDNDNYWREEEQEEEEERAAQQARGNKRRSMIQRLSSSKSKRKEEEEAVEGGSPSSSSFQQQSSSGIIPASSFYGNNPPTVLLDRLKKWLQRECRGGKEGDDQRRRSDYCQSFPKQDLAFHYHDALAGWPSPSSSQGLLLRRIGGGTAAAEEEVYKEEETAQEDDDDDEKGTAEREGEDNAKEKLAPPINHPHTSSLSSSSVVFALKPLRPFSTNLRLWSYEDPSSSHGRRWYNVCRWPDFVQQYLHTMNPTRRHVYEIIREGYPCRLYFDVEFDRLANPGIEGKEIMALLIQMVTATLQEVFGIILPSPTSSCFLQLDSSTPKKFSHHVIVHLPNGQLFRSNLHVGRFVQRILAKAGGPPPPYLPLASPSPASSASMPSSSSSSLTEDDAIGVQIDEEERRSPVVGDLPIEESKHSDDDETERRSQKKKKISLWVVKPSSSSSTIIESDLDPSPSSSSSQPPPPPPPPSSQHHYHQPFFQQQQQQQRQHVLAVDTSVYTKNRAFRLLHSRKFGKSTAFSLTRESLESFQSPGSCSLCPPQSSQSCSHEQEEKEGWLLASLVVPHLPCGHLPPSNLLSLSPQDDDSQPALKLGYLGGHDGLYSSTSASRHHQQGTSFHAFETSDGGKPSPLPALDHYIRSQVTRGGVQGIIRGWQYSYSTSSPEAAGGGSSSSSKSSSLLTYQIGRNRWCGNIGRSHKSNHIMWVVDLRKGYYYQKCHDPECRHYRSGTFPLPPQLQPDASLLDQIELDATLADDIARHPERWDAAPGDVPTSTLHT